jgi:hypothetical protein
MDPDNARKAKDIKDYEPPALHVERSDIRQVFAKSRGATPIDP